MSKLWTIYVFDWKNLISIFGIPYFPVLPYHTAFSLCFFRMFASSVSFGTLQEFLARNAKIWRHWPLVFNHQSERTDSARNLEKIILEMWTGPGRPVIYKLVCVGKMEKLRKKFSERKRKCCANESRIWMSVDTCLNNSLWGTGWKQIGFFRPSATVSRIGLVESCLRRRCRFVGVVVGPPTPWLADPPPAGLPP